MADDERPMTMNEARAELVPLIERIGELCLEQLIEGAHAGAVAAACVDAAAKAIAIAQDEDFFGGRRAAFEGLLTAARATFNAAVQVVDRDRRTANDRDSAVARGPAGGDAGAGPADSGRRGRARDAEGGSVEHEGADSGDDTEAAGAPAVGRDTAAAVRRRFHIIH